MTAPVTTHRINGESLYQFKNHFLFVLKNKLYLKAGKNHWPKAYEQGILRSKGVSINTSIYKKVMQSPLPLIIFDVNSNNYYKLTNQRRASQHVGVETRGNTKLAVLPIDAFTKLQKYEHHSTVVSNIL